MDSKLNKITSYIVKITSSYILVLSKSGVVVHSSLYSLMEIIKQLLTIHQTKVNDS